MVVGVKFMWAWGDRSGICCRGWRFYGFFCSFFFSCVVCFCEREKRKMGNGVSFSSRGVKWSGGEGMCGFLEWVD